MRDRAHFPAAMLALLVAAAPLALLRHHAVAGEARPFVVIVNQSNPVSSIGRDKLERIFLKKTTRWENGDVIYPVDREGSSPLRELFCREVMGSSPRTVEDYWRQRIFAGRSLPPPERASDEEVIAYVTNHPAAVGYVSAEAPLEGVKALEIR